MCTAVKRRLLCLQLQLRFEDYSAENCSVGELLKVGYEWVTRWLQLYKFTVLSRALKVATVVKADSVGKGVTFAAVMCTYYVKTRV